MMDIKQIFNSKYQLKNLKVDRTRFLDKLREYTQNQGPWMIPGVDFTKTTRWGHNHDFGEGVCVPGTMEDRHYRIMNRFLQEGLPSDLAGKQVLVIGCYTGGDALSLAALGAEVDAVEEVPLYAEISAWLADSFGAKLKVHTGSIDREAIRSKYKAQSFDFIYNAGVIYHLRNIICGLENCHYFLKDNGIMFLETMVAEGQLIDPIKEKLLIYRGPSVSGYNWYLPNVEAVLAICKDIGFTPRFFHAEPNSRASFICKKP